MLDFLSILQAIGDVIQADWLYQGWRFLLSKKYRAACREDWIKHGALHKSIVIVLSVSVMLLELALLFYIYHAITHTSSK